ncbi:hypothetical protein MLD38_020651 [Melastoma candidum]|uniref:Uncharacterized protein n=1 Tax=Melastoma candidum TaxID=119954 RepID=A0ACB9QCZ5_9MYRT|nr:hypothetical protein MLD38_020651 [Melastoma candidum]
MFVSAGISSNVGTICMAILRMSLAGTCLSCTLIGMAFCFQWNVTCLEAATPVTVFSGIVAYTINRHCIVSMDYVVRGTYLGITHKHQGNGLEPVESSQPGVFQARCGLTSLFEATIVQETKGRSKEEMQAPLTNFLS